MLRANGPIVGGGAAASTGVAAKSVVKQLRSLGEQKSIKAVVLRVDSPGGDALASDVMYREVQKLAEVRGCEGVVIGCGLEEFVRSTCAGASSPL